MLESIHKNKLFDSHAHISASILQKDADRVISDASANSVEAIIDVGIDLETSKYTVGLATNNPSVYAAIGIDPQILIPNEEGFNKDYLEEEYQLQKIKELESLIQGENIAMIGEAGMDDFYYRRLIQNGFITQQQRVDLLNAQESLFRLHLELARKYKLPLTIHSRYIEARCVSIAKDYPDVTGIFHSFTGSYKNLRRIREIGWGVGVNGIVTLDSADQIRHIYKKLLGEVSGDWGPSDFYKRGVFFETDSPYLLPKGEEGHVNYPKNTRTVFEQFRRFLST